MGQQYEPYIFAALNSAKVMLVVGTDRDHFNAPWVRNEWGRYLAILKKQGGRLLIPCYRDMDAYDLPDELSVFQCQDMGKVGFEQDLIRGIRKVLSSSDSTPADKPAQVSGPSVASLLKRAELFLGDHNWGSATNYYNQALDISPECAEAYVGLLCAECTSESIESLGLSYFGVLKQQAQSTLSASNRQLFSDTVQPPRLKPLDELLNYKKAVRFGDAQLQASLAEQACISKDKTTEFLEVLIREDNDALDSIQKKRDLADAAFQKAQNDRDSRRVSVERERQEGVNFIARVVTVIFLGSIGMGLILWSCGAFGYGTLTGVIGFFVAALVSSYMHKSNDQRRDAGNRQVSELTSKVEKLRIDLKPLNEEISRVERRLETEKRLLDFWMGKASLPESFHKYMCSACNHIFECSSLPYVCPNCKAPQSGLICIGEE